MFSVFLREAFSNRDDKVLLGEKRGNCGNNKSDVYFKKDFHSYQLTKAECKMCRLKKIKSFSVQ